MMGSWLKQEELLEEAASHCTQLFQVTFEMGSTYLHLFFVFCLFWGFFLPLDKKGKLETDITKEELYIALKSMKNRKVPGIDRLRREIYMTFWDLLRSHLGEIINEMKLK